MINNDKINIKTNTVFFLIKASITSFMKANGK